MKKGRVCPQSSLLGERHREFKCRAIMTYRYSDHTVQWEKRGEGRIT